MAKRPSNPKVRTRFKEKQLRRQFFKQWRKYRQHTLEEAAELAGMTAGNLSAIERGEQGFSPEGLQALADAYGCDTGDLLNQDPFEQPGLRQTWDKATAAQRDLIVKLAQQVVGGVKKTGTDG